MDEILNEFTKLYNTYFTFDVRIRIILVLMSLTIVFGITKVIDNYYEELEKETTEE